MVLFNKHYILYVTVKKYHADSVTHFQPVLVYGFLTFINVQFLGGRLIILPYKLANYIVSLLNRVYAWIQMR